MFLVEKIVYAIDQNFVVNDKLGHIYFVNILLSPLNSFSEISKLSMCFQFFFDFLFGFALKKVTVIENGVVFIEPFFNLDLLSSHASFVKIFE